MLTSLLHPKSRFMFQAEKVDIMDGAEPEVITQKGNAESVADGLSGSGLTDLDVFSGLEEDDEKVKQVKQEQEAAKLAKEQALENLEPEAEKKPEPEKKEGLEKIPGKVEEPKDKKEASKVPEKDDDIDAIQPRPGAHPKAVDDIRKLKEQTKAARTEARELQAKLKEFETKPAAAPEEITKLQTEIQERDKRIKELETYEFIARPEASAIIKRDYDSKIEKTHANIYDLLTKNKLPAKSEDPDDLTLEKLKAVGGPLGHAPYEWWVANVFPRMNPLDAEKLKAQLMESHSLAEQKSQAIQNAPQEAERIQKDLASQYEQKGKDWVSEAQKAINDIAPTVPYGKKVEILPTMSKEEKETAEGINKFNDEAVKMFPGLVQPKTAADAVKVASGFVYALYLEQEHGKLQKAYDSLAQKSKEQETLIGNIKKGSSTRLGGTHNAPKEHEEDSKGKENVKWLTMSADDAMAELDKSE